MRDAKGIIIDKKATIKDALKVIDKGHIQIALIAEDNKLLGTLSDGDIRRACLNGFTLDHSIEKIYNRNPIKLHINQTKEEILRCALDAKIRQIPVVDDKGAIVGIEYLGDILRSEEKTNIVILLAGGIGKRLKPFTEEMPKPMLKVGSKPILQTTIETISKYRFKNFYLSINYKAAKIREYFKDGRDFGVNIKYINEQKAMGTAGSLSLLREKPSKPFFVMNGDLLTNVNPEHLLNYHLENNAQATVCITEYDLQVPYGVVKIDNSTVSSIIEKPIQKIFINAGIYVFNPEILGLISKNRFLDMTTFIQELLKKGYRILSFPLREYWIDIGKISDFHKANSEYYEMFDA